MTTVKSPLELYKLLPKSNCRQCRLPSCLAFAAAVIKGEQNIESCPHLEENVIRQLDVAIEKPIVSAEQQMLKYMEEFRGQIHKIDLFSTAQRLGGTFEAGKMTIRCLGKSYNVFADGRITSECHINPWIIMPLINYILRSPGNNPKEQWIPFRELNGGISWNPLFEQRCEKRLKQIADEHREIFEYLLCIFGGQPDRSSPSADISLVLRPLPKFPVSICYSRLEHPGQTGLNIFFDVTASDNIGIDSVFALFAGLVTMMDKITEKHSFSQGRPPKRPAGAETGT